MKLSDELSTVIERALKRCHDFLITSTWHGRENELVNLFAHHCLPPGNAVRRLFAITVPGGG